MANPSKASFPSAPSLIITYGRSTVVTTRRVSDSSSVSSKKEISSVSDAKPPPLLDQSAILEIFGYL